MTDKIVNIARDFSKFPTGRYKEHGEGSGEAFRDVFLLPDLRSGVNLTISLDGVVGYPSSFLEEAFGGLIRNNITLEAIKNQLKITYSDSTYEAYKYLAWKFIEEASSRRLEQ